MPTRKVALPLLAALLLVAMVGVAVKAVASERAFTTPVVASGCALVNGQLVCRHIEKHPKRHKHRQQDDARQGDDQTPCPSGKAAGLRKSGSRCATQAEDEEQDPAPAGGAAFECSLRHGKLVCGKTLGTRKKGGNDNQQGEEGASGERSCPPGYVVLEKKNKYGAFCEPKEGFPAQAKQCPAYTEPDGDRGCVPKWREYSKTIPKEAETAFKDLCDKNHAAYTNCGIPDAQHFDCTCHYQEQ